MLMWNASIKYVGLSLNKGLLSSRDEYDAMASCIRHAKCSGTTIDIRYTGVAGDVVQSLRDVASSIGCTIVSDDGASEGMGRAVANDRAPPPDPPSPYLEMPARNVHQGA